MKLKDFIKNNGLKQKHLAKKLSLSPSYFSQVINDKVEPSFNLIKRIEQETNGQVTRNDF